MMDLDDLDAMARRETGRAYCADESPNDEANVVLECVPALIAVARATQNPTIGIIDDLCNGLGCGDCLLCLHAALAAKLAEMP